MFVWTSWSSYLFYVKTQIIEPRLNYSLENIPKEVWKPCIGYTDYYEVSSYGRVKSLSRMIKRRGNGFFLKEEKILKQSIPKNNQCYVGFSIDGVLKTQSVMILVGAAFLRDKKPEEVYYHKSKNTLDNTLKNIGIKLKAEIAKDTRFKTEYKFIAYDKNNNFVIQLSKREIIALYNDYAYVSIVKVAKGNNKSYETCYGYYWKKEKIITGPKITVLLNFKNKDLTISTSLLDVLTDQEIKEKYIGTFFNFKYKGYGYEKCISVNVLR